MGIAVVVTTSLFEPIPDGAHRFDLRAATARAIARQPEATPTSGIDAVADAAFNRNQLPRLLQELRSLARGSDDFVRRNLEDAASFIETETDAIGPGADCYVAFLGD